MWKLYAILAAIFAALTSIFAKIGIENIDSNLATAIRTVVILLITFGIIFTTRVYNQIPNITHKCWLFLILSGIATGLSWLFYFKAIRFSSSTNRQIKHRNHYNISLFYLKRNN